MNYTAYVSVKFITELVLVVALYASHYERKPHFWIKLPICLVMCYAFSYFTSPVFLMFYRWKEPVATVVAILRYTSIFAVVALAIYFLFQLNLRASFFICAGAYAVQHIILKLYGLIEAQYIDNLSIYVVAVIYAIYLVLSYGGAYFLVIRHLQQEDAARVNADDTFLVNLLIVTSLIVIDVFASDLIFISVLGEIAFAGYGVICGVFLLSLQKSIYKRGAIEKENEQIEYILEQEQKRFESFRDSVDYLNIKCHDLKHQIHRLKQAAVVKAETISELEADISQYESFSDTGFPALDIILGEKYLACKTKGIEFTALVSGEKLSHLTDPDIYSLFGNALDNAIEYEEKLSEDIRLIHLDVKDVGNMLFIRIENTYNGPEIAGDELETSKDDKQYHGFGMKSMHHIVKKYGGEMDVNTKNGLFCLVCMFTF